MAVSLLPLFLALQSAKTAPIKVLAPDVLLTRTEESAGAEKSLNDRKLDPSRLLFLTQSKPVIACYGRLAKEARDYRSTVDSVVALLHDGDGVVWTRERTEAVRSMMLKSPFRDGITKNAQRGTAMSLQFNRATTIALLLPSGYYQIMPLSREPLGKPVDLVTTPLRLAKYATSAPVDPNPDEGSHNSIACLVSRSTTSQERIPFMQAGLKALQTKQTEAALLLARALPPPPPLELTDGERTKAIDYFANAYGDLGYASREAAAKALQSARLFKYGSLEADIDSARVDGQPSRVGWTVTNLTNG